MMIKTIFAILSLANCCFFSGADYTSSKGICSKYPPPKKNEPVFCSTEFDPICDSKGHTHDNMCYFCAERWYTKGPLTIRYKGECKENIICSKYPRPKKDETVMCTMELYLICGSDGHTYGNKCLFCAARWSSKGTLLIRYEGQCNEEALCSKYPMPKKGEPIGCTEEHDPICGSDGEKYGNRCYFCIAWRMSGGTLTIRHEGECRPKDHYKKS